MLCLVGHFTHTHTHTHTRARTDTNTRTTAHVDDTTGINAKTTVNCDSWESLFWHDTVATINSALAAFHVSDGEH